MPREFSTRTNSAFLWRKMTLRDQPWSETRVTKQFVYAEWVEIYVDGQWKPQFWGRLVRS